MPSIGQPAVSLTGLFEASWRPQKSVTVLWRRVPTISPDDFAAVLTWARSASDDADRPWLEAMVTNEVTVEPVAAVIELTALAQREPPPAVAEALATLRDLIWEACDSNSDWLTWRPCRRCGRRWATLPLEGVPLCPRHRAVDVLLPLLREEMALYDGLVDHTAALARLEQAVLAGPSPALPPTVGVDELPAAGDAPVGLLPDDDEPATAPTTSA